tara:strand:+ start:1251 stop:1637 length:387 start_codon:yes stop_codon:yes gene_type:complete
MQINNLMDLNSLRSAPNLNTNESNRILRQIDKKILIADWVTIGIMAQTDQEAKVALNSIIKKYDYKFFKNFDQIKASGTVFLKANQKTGEVYIRSENGLGEGILLTCQYNDLSLSSKTYGPFPLKLFT